MTFMQKQSMSLDLHSKNISQSFVTLKFSNCIILAGKWDLGLEIERKNENAQTTKCQRVLRCSS